MNEKQIDILIQYLKEDIDQLTLEKVILDSKIDDMSYVKDVEIPIVKTPLGYILRE